MPLRKSARVSKRKRKGGTFKNKIGHIYRSMTPRKRKPRVPAINLGEAKNNMTNLKSKMNAVNKNLKSNKNSPYKYPNISRL